MNKRTIAIDWARKDDNVAWTDGKEFHVGWPDPSPDLLIVTENMPSEKLEDYIHAGGEVLRCNTDVTAKYRNKHDIDKTHKKDAGLIWYAFKQEPQSFRPVSVASPLQAYYAMFKDMQDMRMVTANRMRYNENAKGNELLGDIEKLEKKALKIVGDELKGYRIYNEWLRHIKGISVATSAGLIAYIGDIKRFNHISALWKYFGLDVRNGQAPRRRVGEVANWSQKGRCLVLGVIGDLFIKMNTPLYRPIYDAEKARQLAIEAANPGTLNPQNFGGKNHKPLGHAHRRAIRKMSKLFLSHLWQVWREQEGLLVSQPWSHAHGGHVDFIPPPKFIEVSVISASKHL